MVTEKSSTIASNIIFVFLFMFQISLVYASYTKYGNSMYMNEDCELGSDGYL